MIEDTREALTRAAYAAVERAIRQERARTIAAVGEALGESGPNCARTSMEREAGLFTRTLELEAKVNERSLSQLTKMGDAFDRMERRINSVIVSGGERDKVHLDA
jgi:hypothetical protein